MQFLDILLYTETTRSLQFANVTVIAPASMSLSCLQRHNCYKTLHLWNIAFILILCRGNHLISTKKLRCTVFPQNSLILFVNQYTGMQILQLSCVIQEKGRNLLTSDFHKSWPDFCCCTHDWRPSNGTRWMVCLVQRYLFGCCRWLCL